MPSRLVRRRLGLALKRRREQLDARAAEEQRKEKPRSFFGSAFFKPSAIRMIAGTSRAAKTNHQTENAEHRANEASLAKSTGTIATFTKVLAAIGLLSAGVSFFQWREMNSSGAQADKLIEANKNLAAAAQQSANTSDKNLIATQRAWVGTTDANISGGTISAPVKGTVFYVNSGREPARFHPDASEYVYSRGSWDSGSAESAIVANKEQCFSIKQVDGQQFVWPSTGLSSYIAHVPSKRIPQPGVVAWSDDIVKGNDIFVIDGCFVYEAFGEIHHTAFCYFYDSKMTDMQHLNICTFGNDVN